MYPERTPRFPAIVPPAVEHQGHFSTPEEVLGRFLPSLAGQEPGPSPADRPYPRARDGAVRDGIMYDRFGRPMGPAQQAMYEAGGYDTSSTNAQAAVRPYFRPDGGLVRQTRPAPVPRAAMPRSTTEPRRRAAEQGRQPARRSGPSQETRRAMDLYLKNPYIAGRYTLGLVAAAGAEVALGAMEPATPREALVAAAGSVLPQASEATNAIIETLNNAPDAKAFMVGAAAIAGAIGLRAARHIFGQMQRLRSQAIMPLETRRRYDKELVERYSLWNRTREALGGVALGVSSAAVWGAAANLASEGVDIAIAAGTTLSGAAMAFTALGLTHLKNRSEPSIKVRIPGASLGYGD